MINPPCRYPPPPDVIPLLPVLQDKLMELLYSLKPAQWQFKTIAGRWTVKDVVSHLLDGNIRALSMARDGYIDEQSGPSPDEELVHYLDGLNADWVKAMKRVSPAMLILLHQITGPLFHTYYSSLDPGGKAIFPVAWAGESDSLNSMHIAREYTEKWLHQQQVRDAIGDDGIMSREFFYPFIDIFMRALPYTYRAVPAAEGTLVRVHIPGEAGGAWDLVKNEDGWVLEQNRLDTPTSEVIMDADIAWRLFSKSMRPQDVENRVQILGDQHLGQVALTMVSVMA